MPKRKKARKRPRRTLDKSFEKGPSRAQKTRRSEPFAKAYDPYSMKRLRGRPAKIPASTVIGRADNYRYQLKQVWNKLEAPLLAAQTEEEVKAAFENHAQPYSGDFMPWRLSDVLALIHDKHFPRDSDARINFLADSLGGSPSLTFRSSRDVCGRERAKERLKSPYKILRKEFYVECSCGYKGPARDNACRKCGARISLIEEIISSGGVF
jgi:hypothetical protein